MRNTNNAIKVNFEINDVVVSLNLSGKNIDSNLNSVPEAVDINDEPYMDCSDMSNAVAVAANTADYNNLTQDEKQFYADVLNFIFRGTIGNVQAYQITPNVAKAADFFLGEIAHCSQGLTATLVGIPGGQLYSIAFNIFLNRVEKYLYIPYIRALIIETVTSYYVGKIFEYIFKNARYRICVDVINVRWKSQMGLLLYGIIDDLPY